MFPHRMNFGSLPSAWDIVDLIDSDEEPSNRPVAQAPASTRRATGFSNPFAFVQRRETEVIDLISSESESEREAPPPLSPAPPHPPLSQLPPPTTHTTIQHGHTNVADSATTPRSSKARPAPDSGTNQPSTKKRKIAIKEEFPPKDFGEADVGDEVVEIAPEELVVPAADDVSTPMAVSGPTTMDDDNEFEILETNMTVASDMPHQREGCTLHPFAAKAVPNSFLWASNLKFCANCYCYVCQIKASDCPDWSHHCHATYRLPMWKQLQKEMSGPTARLLTPAQRQIFTDEYSDLLPSLGLLDEDDHLDDEVDDDDSAFPYPHFGGIMRAPCRSRRFNKVVVELLTDADPDHWAALTMLVIKGLDDLVDEETTHSCKTAVLLCVSSLHCSNSAVQVITSKLQHWDLGGLLPLITFIRKFLDDPNANYPRRPAAFDGLAPEIRLVLVREVYDRMDIEFLSTMVMEPHPHLMEVVVWRYVQALDEQTPVDWERLRLRLSHLMQLRGMPLECSYYPIPLGILRLVALLMFTVAPRHLLPHLLQMIRVCINGDVDLADYQQWGDAVIGEALEKATTLRNPTVSTLDWVCEHTNADTPSRQTIAALALGLAYRFSQHAGPNFVCEISLAKLDCAHALLANFCFRLGGALEMACTYAQASLSSCHVNSFRLVPELLTELSRLPFFTHVPSEFGGISSFRISPYSMVPEYREHVTLEFPSFRDLQLAVLRPDSMIMRVQSQHILGNCLRMSQFLELWRALMAPMSGPDDAEVVRCWLKQEPRWRCAWKAVVIALLRFVYCRERVDEDVVIGFGAMAGQAARLHRVVSSVQFMSDHGSASFLLLHGVRVLEMIGSRLSSKPSLSQLSEVKKHIMNLKALVLLRPENFQDLHYMYVLEAMGPENAVDVCCSMWKCMLFACLGPAPAAPLSDRLSVALLEENWTEVQRALAEATNIDCMCSLAMLTCELLVWPDDSWDLYLNRLVPLVEVAVKKTAPYGTVEAYSTMSSRTMKSTGATSLLYRVFMHLSAATVIAHAHPKAPLLAARLACLLADPAISAPERETLEAAKTRLMSECVACKSLVEEEQAFFTMIFLGELQRYVARVTSLEALPSIFHPCGPGHFTSMLQQAVSCCPEMFVEQLVAATMSTLMNHGVQVVAAVTAQVGDRVDTYTKARWELLAYRCSTSSHVANALLAADRCPELIARLTAWLRSRDLQKQPWGEHFSMLRLVLSPEDFDKELLDFDIMGAGAQEDSVRSFANSLRAMLPDLVDRGAAICGIVRCMLLDTSLATAMGFLSAVQTEWLGYDPSCVPEGPTAQEVRFSKIFILMLRDPDNVATYWAHLKAMAEVFEQRKLAVLGIMSDPCDIERSVQFHVRLREFAGLAVFIGALPTPAVPAALQVIVSMLTPELVLEAQDGVAFEDGCVASLVDTSSFLWAMFKLIASLQGRSGDKPNVGIAHLTRALVALFPQNRFLQNFVACAETFLAAFNSATFHALPPQMQQLLSGPPSLMWRMVDCLTVSAGLSERLGLITLVAHLMASGALVCMQPGRVLAEGAAAELFQRMVFCPLASAPNGTGLVDAADVDLVVLSLRPVIKKFKGVIGIALEETLLRWLLHDSRRDPATFRYDLLVTDRTQVPRPLGARQWQLRELCLEMATVCQGFAYFGALASAANSALPASGIVAASLLQLQRVAARPPHIFALWKLLVKAIFFYGVAMVDGGNPEVVFSVVTMAHSPRSAGTGALLTDAEGVTALKLFDVRWVSLYPHYVLTLADVLATPHVLVHLTIDMVLGLRDQLFFCGNVLGFWKQLLDGAGEARRAQIMGLVLEAVRNLGLSLASITVHARLRSAVEAFCTALQPVLRRYPQFDRNIAEAVAHAARLVRTKKPVVAALNRIVS